MPALFAIILVLALTIFLLYIILKDFGIITRKQKIITLSVLILFGVLASIYNYFQNKSGKNDMLIQTAFKRGDSLECQEVIVNKENFNLVSATLVFIGKKDGPMNNIILPLDKCKIIPQDSSPQDSTSTTLEEELQRD